MIDIGYYRKQLVIIAIKRTFHFNAFVIGVIDRTLINGNTLATLSKLPVVMTKSRNGKKGKTEKKNESMVAFIANCLCGEAAVMDVNRTKQRIFGIEISCANSYRLRVHYFLLSPGNGHEANTEDTRYYQGC